MPSTIITVQIGAASDGTGAAPINAQDMRQNDAYFLEKIAEMWMKDTGRAQPHVTYRLERLPAGYRGFEHTRAQNTSGKAHVDRYLYGHPQGVFRSLKELYPHFKHLQDYADPRGCECKLCVGKKSATISISSSASTSTPKSKPKSKPLSAQPKASQFAKSETVQSGAEGLPQGRLTSHSPVATRREQTDEEGTPDYYRTLLDKLQDAGPEGLVDEEIVDQLSPDWRAGHELLQGLIMEWRELPNYVPRIGEVVMFTRSTHLIAWDAASDVLRHIDPITKSWLQQPQWEAGVVTQMPVEAISANDLLGTKLHKKQNVTYSGFRIEPLSEPGKDSKLLATRHKWVPLHAIRPFAFWQDCVGDDSSRWHPTIMHALAMANSFSILSRYHFKGTWPEATVFASALYIGPELILLGDTVKLMPLEGKSVVTEVLHITSIRLQFVDMDRASSDDYDNGLPYITCLHVSGKAFTLDPKKSFGGIAKSPAVPGQGGLPHGLGFYGQWFHIVDPSREKGRLEIPFQRVLGRCPSDAAVQAWFASSREIFGGDAPTTLDSSKAKVCNISRSLPGVQQARAYSIQNDRRIDRKAGKTWFWADTRIEQLDLDEVNGKFVGPKDETRSAKQVHAWRQALKVMDGKRSGVEAYYAARDKRKEEERLGSANVLSASWGMMAGGVQIDSDTDAERAEAEAEAEDADGDGDGMDIDDVNEQGESGSPIINLTISDDEDEESE